MAVPNTALWHVRAGGNNVNGGGYDPSVSGVLSTTTSGTLSSGATSMTVASASGWPSSGNYYARIATNGNGPEPSGGGSEIVQVTGGQGTTTWTIVRARLGTTALAFASGVTVSNDLSACDTAPASGTVGTSTASTTFVDATFAAFNATHVGNVLWLASGTGTTPGAYFIQSVSSATTVILDRASGTYTAGVWKVGGGWANINTNMATFVPGNIVYLRGTTGTVSSPDYTLSGPWVNVSGDNTNGLIRLIGENNRPYIKASDQVIYNGTNQWVENLYAIASTAGKSVFGNGGGYNVYYNVIVDQHGIDCNGLGTNGLLVNCEVFSSTTNSGASGSNFAVSNVYGTAMMMVNCNIHDTWGPGVNGGNNTLIMDNCIVANCPSDGITIGNGSSMAQGMIQNCTITGNKGHGINLNSVAQFQTLYAIMNNIIANQTGAGKYGIYITSGTTVTDDRLRNFVNFNWFYNNTANSNALTVGSRVYINGSLQQDSIGVDPQFANTSNENFALAAASAAINAGLPVTAFLNSLSGKTGPRSYVSMGAVQPTGATPPAAPLIGGW